MGPALFASLFATGVKKQIFGGYFIWVILVALTIGYNIAMRWLPAKAEGKLYGTVEEEEDEPVI